MQNLFPESSSLTKRKTTRNGQMKKKCGKNFVETKTIRNFAR
jgi:hypothetical protein